MRIGINLLAFLPNVSGGAELYALNLLKALAKTDQDNDYYLITNKDNRHYYKIESSRFHYVQQDVRARPQIKRVMWEQALLPVIARRLRLDVLHSPSYTWPILCTVRGVVTIHDMLYKDYPEWIGEPKLTFWRLFVTLSAWRCKKIFTVSDASKQAIAKYLNVPLDKIIVVPGSLDTDFSTLVDSEMEIGQTCHKYNIRRPYLLNVGGLAPHKNAASLVKALRGLHERPETRDLTLVITGNDNGAKQAISSLTSSLNLNDHISLPGYVEKKDLPAI